MRAISALCTELAARLSATPHMLSLVPCHGWSRSRQAVRACDLQQMH